MSPADCSVGAGGILPEVRAQNYRPIKRKRPHEVIRNMASAAMENDILLVPWARSMNVIGISPMEAPQAKALRVISI